MRKYFPYYKRNLRLAFPIVLSQIGQIVVQQADIMMVGQLGATELAAIAFANSIFVFGIVFAMGFSLGLTPAVGHIKDKTQLQLLGKLLSNAYIINLVITSALIFLLFGVSFFFGQMGQDTEVVALARPYFLTILISMFPMSLFFTNKQFAEGLGDTKNAMVITLSANIVNIVLNYLLIFGKFGFPQMGVLGAGVATLIARVFMALSFYIVFTKRSLFRSIAQHISLKMYELKTLKKLFFVGFPISVQMLLEVTAFAVSGIMAGWLGVISLAAHQIALGLASVTFMLAIGVGAATTIRVSHYYGKKDFQNLIGAANASTHIVLTFMGLSGLSLFIFRYILPHFYTQDTEVIQLSATLISAAAIFQIFDGLQLVMISILRGMGDVKHAMWYAFIAYILVNLPTSYLFAFTFDFGTLGLWLGLIIGLTTAGLLFYSRIRYLYKKMSAC